MRRESTPAAALVAFAWTLAAVGCLGRGPGSSEATYAFTAEEEQHRKARDESPVILNGVIVDVDGVGIEGARVRVLGSDGLAATADQGVLTDPSGRFSVDGLPRRGVCFEVSAAGHYTEIVAADLQRPLSEGAIEVPAVPMVATAPGRVRFIFGGDSMFGRRYLDRDEDGVLGEEEDLIREGSLADDASALLRFLRPVLESADYTQVNFESPVVLSEEGVHPYKEYSFSSRPETLAALTYAGIDAISLGNNHVYDYMESGMAETIAHVEATGVDWFGAGMDETSAAASRVLRSVNGVDFAMQGFNGIIPIRFPEWSPQPWPDAYLYVARDDPAKGGALELSKTNVRSFLESVRATRFGIPVIHGGDEYGEHPTRNIRSQIANAVAEGAGIVVAHHPHTIYGVAVLDHDEGPRFALLSLGNLVFDQDVFETFQSMVAVVDVDRRGDGRFEVSRVRLVPMHVEGYVPKLVAGDWAHRIGRHVGHISTYLPARAAGASPESDPDGLRGATVFPSGGRIVVLDDPSLAQTVDTAEAVTVDIADGSGDILYGRRGGSDSLARVRTGTPATGQLGRDLMHYGDFEDLDTDDEDQEGSLWNQSAARFVQGAHVRSGVGAFVLLRQAGQETAVSTWLKNRVTFREGCSLTLTGWFAGVDAGRVEIQGRWYVRDERTVISTATILSRDGGSWDWERFSIDLVPPVDAGTFRAYWLQHPPASGEGRVFLDDVQLVQWEDTLSGLDQGVDVPSPNNWSWLRIRPLSSSVETVGVTLTHRELFTRPGSL